MKNLSKLFLILVAGLLLANCSGTYKVKPDMGKWVFLTRLLSGM